MSRRTHPTGQCPLEDPRQRDALIEAIADRVVAKLQGRPAPEETGLSLLQEPGRLRDLVGMVMQSMAAPDIGGPPPVEPSAVTNAALRLPLHEERLGPRR